MGRPKKKNVILENNGEWLLIDISTPKHPEATMAVDSDVWERHKDGRVSAAKPSLGKYICAQYHKKYTGTDRISLFHRDVVGSEDGFQIDHIRHPTMEFIDNRRSNLRKVTRCQNMMNRSVMSNNKSGVTGVSWHKGAKKWEVNISINKKQVCIGYFADLQEAIKTRKDAEKEHYGEHAFKRTK